MAGIADMIQPPQGYKPSIVDEVSSLLRAAREGTSVGAQRDNIIAGQNQQAQTDFTNKVAVADMQGSMLDRSLKAAELEAKQGDRQAKAFMDVMSAIRDDYKEQDLSPIVSAIVNDPRADAAQNAAQLYAIANEHLSRAGMKPTTTRVKPPDGEYERLVKAHERAVAAGDTGRAAALQKRMDYLTTKGTGVTIQMGGGDKPDTGVAPVAPISADTPATELGTGMSGRVGGFVNWLGDTVLGIGQIAPETAEARQAIDLVETMTNTVMAANVPGRPSNYVREQFAKIAPRKGMGDAEAKQSFRRTIQFIESEIASMQKLRPQMTSKANLDSLTSSLGSFEQLRQMYQTLYDNFDETDMPKRELKSGDSFTVDGVEVKIK